MKTIIIEDEFPAAERLKALLEKVAAEVEVLTVLPSVAKATDWLQTQPGPELIFSDIQLADGLSFDIYEAVPPNCPIIFTTAYDEYAIKAFQLQSIDYLLKPIKPTDLRRALDKYQAMKAAFAGGQQQQQMQALLHMLQPTAAPEDPYKRRFLVSHRDQLIPVEESEIAYFFTANELVYLMRQDGQRFAIDFKLEALSKELDPEVFFRLNRQYISRLSAIQRIHPYFHGRLKLSLQPEQEGEVIVSRDKAKEVKKWLGG
ncbi:MAG: LytTR family DNA-binding domain-containing protein [Bacteroidota bacterium]